MIMNGQMKNNKIKVEIYDDKKERHQSFEAKLIDKSWTDYLEGYGADQNEAIEDLKHRVDMRIKTLSNIDFTNIVVKNIKFKLYVTDI